MEKDGWWEQQRIFEEFWEGANSSMALSLLCRNACFEDVAAMVKSAFGKRWDCSRHNTMESKLFGEQLSSQRHPMMTCPDLRMHMSRSQWKKTIEETNKKAPRRQRQLMEEYEREVFHGNRE